MNSGKLDILLAEDWDTDIFFVREATERVGASHTVHAVRDGREAIQYLRGEGQYADRKKFPLPNLILTDLKMPGMDGFEFLRWLRKHPDECSIIPTIVFTSSYLEEDVREAYRLGANSFITKPTALKELVDVLRVTYEYWSRCKCPPRPT